MEYILVRGGSSYAHELAADAGARYGIRYDYKNYAPVWMLDCGLDANWDDYVAVARELRPPRVMVPDYYAADASGLWNKIDTASRYGERVMVCPKFHGALDDIPTDCIIALSVPTPTYAGFLPDISKLHGREVHLLGGNLKRQCDLTVRLNGIGAKLVSADGSYFCMAAANGRWFDGSAWQQQRGYKLSTRELEAISLKNIIAALRRVSSISQPVLI